MAKRGGKSGSTAEFGASAGTPTEAPAPAEKKSVPRVSGVNLGLAYLQESRKQAATGTSGMSESITEDSTGRLKPIMGGPDGNIPMNPHKPDQPLPQDRRHPDWKGVVGELMPPKPLTAQSIIGRARSVKEVAPYQQPIGPRFAGMGQGRNSKKIVQPKEGEYDTATQFFKDKRVDNARKRLEDASTDNAKAIARGFTGAPTRLNAGLARARTLSQTPGRRRMMEKSDIVQAIQGHAAALQGYINQYSNIKFKNDAHAKSIASAQTSLHKLKTAISAHQAAEQKGASATSSEHLWKAASHLHAAQTQLDQPSISEITKDRPAWEVPVVKNGASSEYGLTTEHLLLAAREHHNVQAEPNKDITPEGELGKATARPEGRKPLKSDESPEAAYARQVREQTTNTYTKENNPSTVEKIDPTSIFSNPTGGDKAVGSKVPGPGIGVAEQVAQEARTPSAPQAPNQSGKTVLGTSIDAAKKAAEENAANFAEQQKNATQTKFNEKDSEDVIPAGQRKEARKKNKAERQAVIDTMKSREDAAIAGGQEATEDYKTPEERAAADKKAGKPAKVNMFDDLVATILANRK